MLIERSFDHGVEWHVYRYFASDCAKIFPGIPKGEPKDIDDIICTEKFSTVEPSSGGEVCTCICSVSHGGERCSNNLGKLVLMGGGGGWGEAYPPPSALHQSCRHQFKRHQ